MIEIALHHARSGYFVFPLQPNSKVPLKGSHGFKDATRSEPRIETMWRLEPDANVAIATGPSQLLVVDCDPRKCDSWLKSLRELALPQTFTVRTAGGGWHLYFQRPANSRITVGSNLLPGIDWRARDGYVVAVGSVVNGVTYEVAKALPIAPAPESLLERIGTGRRSREIQRDASGHMTIGDGGRNDRLMQIGAAIRRWGVGYNGILEALRAINVDHCAPCLDDAELRQIAASVAHYPPHSQEAG